MNSHSDRSQTLPILYTVILCTLPHLINISVIATLICICMWGYHLGSLYKGWPIPGLKVRTVLGTILFIMAVLTHEGLTVEAFVALLTLMIALKLFELKKLQDGVIAVILCYFIIVSGMFFNDSIIATFYILFTVLFNTAVLIHIQYPELQLSPAFSLSFQLALRAFPFMIILFLVFPRIQTGFWGRPELLQNKTGFSDTISLGTVASLAQSDKVAFRVTFTSDPPPQDQLYWRGIVLWNFDGQTWKRGNRSRGAASQFQKGTRKIRYNVTLEPHNQQWLFGIDLPTQLQASWSWLRDDHSLYRRRPVSSRFNYTVESYLGARSQARSPNIDLALSLPSTGNPRARDLARQWSQVAGSRMEIVEKAIQFFKTQNIVYTLKPGAIPVSMQGDPIDYFLFSSRSGFCEHFATSLAFLLRAADVPARLVGGYLGGAKNPMGDYWIIRQSDAHAWVEVLNDENIWQRVDPTTIVAPERANLSAEQAIQDDTQASWLSRLGFHEVPQWFTGVRNMWDFANNKWNMWVMEYSISSQRSLFSKIGINISLNKGIVQIVFIAAVLLGATFFLNLVFLRPKKQEQDKVSQYWSTFCTKMQRAGVGRLPSQGPILFLEKIKKQRQDLYDQAAPIVHLYIKLRFSGQYNDDDLAHFRSMTTNFRPGTQHDTTR
ncbi:transglutaminase family protein [Desulfogranum japonicum]|uniref:transglutaminase family protein n=1 Tax=Desulfogranum japonicum TaxID=231447 RepID=UPI0004256B35|nr:transglutaminaseTgpA domain-containing protein [Desulfogranum japonicum]